MVPRDVEGGNRFVIDRMLGKLCVWLRILGYDTLSAADVASHSVRAGVDEDKTLAAFAAHESRILLTRDKNLASAAKKNGVQCVLIKTDTVMEQLKELLRHNVIINCEPVPVRCSECNARLRKVAEEEEDLLRDTGYVPTSKIGTTDFWICVCCGKIFWEGGHWRNMRERLRQFEPPFL